MDYRNFLDDHQSYILIVHYACSNITKEPVEISHIAVGEFVTGNVVPFSRLDYGEKELFEEFSKFLSKKPNHYLLGWNMKDTTYGYPLLKRRAGQLGVDLPEISLDCLIDFDYVMERTYGPNYMNHPPRGKLLNLFEANNVATILCIPGAEEAELFKKDFKKIELSTNCKTRGLLKILELFLADELKTEMGYFRRKIFGFYNSAIGRVILLLGAFCTIILLLIGVVRLFY